ncbi:hypothetical protein D9611_004672 [Ephemerocybe angulata]|uniref:Uncharacterized protein n=1 Tax=Ephemerocybe angulata TaxID=980116 RepID=A0A8H5EXG5_9AGAR|nr:hypothetical protein D9611_004672 [Tulosesus angulatus]
MSFLFRIQASGIANLRQYMRDSVLPSLSYRENDTILPPEGHASHANRLSVRPETYRRFDHMCGLEDEVWSAVHSCLDSLVPATRVGAAKDAFSIPARLQGKFRCNLDARPDHLHRLIPWVDRFPFATVKRILHLSIPETQAWSFQAGRPSHSEPDHDIFTYYTWSLTQTLNARPTARDLRASEDRRMLVAIQPPWIATQRDLEEFANSREFPPFMVPGDTFPEALPESKDRLWAKLWDCCAREKIHYFVVTSYTHWVFGVFTPGYSAAFTSPAIPHNNTVPTIVEMLTFWTISAMGIEGGYKPRHVSEEYDASCYLAPCTIYDFLAAYDEETVVALYLMDVESEEE